MATNHYGQTTGFGTFYALGFGDRIWPDVELQNWQKVENGLLAMNIENFLISRGTYAVISGTSSEGSVTLSTSGDQPAFEGSIDGSYFKIADVITWTISKLVDNKTFYIYIKSVTGQIDPTSIDSIEAEVFDYELTTSGDKKSHLLMAIVTYDSVHGIVLADINPTGQLTRNGFLSHTTKSTDPHGSVLTQTELDVSILKIGGKQSYSEYIYDETFTCGTDKIIAVKTLLGLDSSVDLSVKYVQICVTGFGTAPVNPYFLWVEYDTGSDTSQFTIKSAGTTAYSMTAKISVKYVINT